MWSFRRASRAIAAAAICHIGCCAAYAGTPATLDVTAHVTQEPSAPAADFAGLEPAFLDVRLNGQTPGRTLLTYHGGPADIFFVPVEPLRDWHLGLDRARIVMHDGLQYIALSDLPGMSFVLDEAAQSLALTVAPDMIASTQLDFSRSDRSPMTASTYGGFINYDIVGELSDGARGANAAIELGLFSPHGVGVSSFVSRMSDSHGEVVRLETSWTIDDPERMRSLRIGDSVSDGGATGAPLRFAGLQFARNFAVDPDYITFPMASLGGMAALPSVVDVYVNNQRRQQRNIAPGPFQINDIPVVTGTGDVRLVVRDLLGREVIINRSYYAAPQLLRRGLFDFSYAAGALREQFGRRSNDYRELFFSGTQSYGLTDWLTTESHVEASHETQNASASVVVLLPRAGVLNVAAAASHANGRSGWLVGGGLERKSPGLSLGIHAEFTTETFRTLDTSFSHDRVRSLVQAFVGLPTRFGSIGASYIRQDVRDRIDADYLSVNGSIRLPWLGSLSVSARQSFGGPGGVAIQTFLTIPVGARTHASASARSGDGERNVRVDLQRSLPSGEGWGYRVAATTGTYDRIEGEVSAQTGAQNLDAEFVATDHRAGARLGVSGAFGFLDGTLFASRALNQSFAAVHVGDFENVRVYADNQLVAKTNRAGVAIVPDLRAYERNSVRIELADLPLDASVSIQEASPRPFARSGVSLDFGVSRSRTAMLRVMLDDGSPLPEGSVVHVQDNPQTFVSMAGGDLYVTDIARTNTVYVERGDNRCSFRFELPQTDDPQPRLGQFVCHLVQP